MEELLKLSRQMAAARFKSYSAYGKLTKMVTADYEDWRYSSDGSELVVDQLNKIGYCCPICEADLKSASATIDHLEPKSRHYDKALKTSNMLVMCWTCNHDKGNKEFSSWREHLPQGQRQSLDDTIRLIHGKARLKELLSDN